MSKKAKKSDAEPKPPKTVLLWWWCREHEDTYSRHATEGEPVKRHRCPRCKGLLVPFSLDEKKWIEKWGQLPVEALT